MRKYSHVLRCATVQKYECDRELAGSGEALPDLAHYIMGLYSHEAVCILHFAGGRSTWWGMRGFPIILSVPALGLGAFSLIFSGIKLANFRVYSKSHSMNCMIADVWAKSVAAAPYQPIPARPCATTQLTE